MEVRIGYTRCKLDEGLVNFGKNEEQAFNQMKLIDKLNLGVCYAEMHKPSTVIESTIKTELNPKEKEHKDLNLQERLDVFEEHKAKEINKARYAFKKSKMWRGAIYGAGFAGLGASARWFLEHFGIIGGGSIPSHEAEMPASSGSGYESGKGPEMFPGEKYFGESVSSEKTKSIVDQFLKKDFRYHPEWKSSGLEQAGALEGLEAQLRAAGAEDPLEIIKGVKEQLNGDGHIFIVSNPAEGPGGAETAAGGGSKGADVLTDNKPSGTAPVEHAAGAKSEAVRLVNEIENTGGVKHDSIWRSTHDLVREHAKEMGMEYPGKGGTKLSEVEWYNLKASQLVNELDKSTPDGIKDLVHEADKVIATKGSDGKFHIVLEESSGIKSGRLADLHASREDKIGEIIKNYEAGKSSEVVSAEAVSIDSKLEDLKSSGVDSDDLEKLTVKDINDLTPEQIASIKDYTEKFEALKKIGISEDDINSLTEKDIRDLTPEQIKNLALDRAAQPNESPQELEIDKDFFKEKPASPHETVKTSADIGHTAQAEAVNNIKINTDKLAADIEFKYNSNGKPVDMEIPSVKAGSHIDHLAYLDKSNLQSFDARTEGTRLSTYMEIYNKLKVDNMTGESGVVAEKIKNIVQNIEKTRSGIIDYSKLPQEIRGKLPEYLRK